MPQPNVLRKVKVDGIWVLLPVSKVNGKIDWTKLDYKGRQIPSVDGTFYLDYRESGRRIRRAVGNHPMQAKKAVAVQGRVLELRDAGMDVEDAPEIQAYQKAEGPKLADAIQQFVTNPPVKLRKSRRPSTRMHCASSADGPARPTCPSWSGQTSTTSCRTWSTCSGLTRLLPSTKGTSFFR